MKSLQGHLLAASPHLVEDNFLRSVVFLIQHDDEGALGVILNRPTQNLLSDVWKEVGDGTTVPPQPIFLGGPVPGPLMVLHHEAAFAESQVLPRVFVTTEKDSLAQLFSNGTSSPFRVFSGYSGWAAGQLESELRSGGWLTTATKSDEIFSSCEDLWERVMRRIGLEIIAPRVKQNRVPDDPSVN